MRGACALAIAAAVLLGAADPAGAATRYDPALRFRTIATPHFFVHYHQREEALARRLARIAEDVHADLTSRMGHAPRERTHVVLVDQHDFAGGWATPVPYNLIEISATGPAASSLIGHTSDWLRLVFTHEYTHVLHLEQSRGWARAAAAVFGRVPFAMPNLSLPSWHIEGLATYEESRGGEGRLHAGDFDAIVREAARAERFEPIDRVGGGLIDWPSGHAPYAYGARFHAYLAERFGDAQLRQLSHRTAGRVPYFTAGAFRRVYGRSLLELWEDFRQAERERVQRTGSEDLAPIRLTRTGYVVSGPRFDRDGTIVYSRRDPHGWPGVERIPVDGGRPERLATRVGGEQLGMSESALYFDALEMQRGVALTSDLYRLDRTTGGLLRLTKGARLVDPDVSPDGARLAAVLLDAHRRDLVVLKGVGGGSEEGRGGVGAEADRMSAQDHLTDQILLTKEVADAQFSRPRWSPDGRFLAAESRTAGLSNIVVVDVERRAVNVIAPAPGRSVTPAWTPDGRALVFASDRQGPTFDLYRAGINSDGTPAANLDRLTDWPGGAHSPDVSADGGTIVFVGYTADGYDLFTAALADAPAADSPPAPPVPPRPSARIPEPPEQRAEDLAAIDPDSRPYRPWSTMLPRAWVPVIETDDDQLELGAATGGRDALAYHTWHLSASWPVARSHAAADLPGRFRGSLNAAYVYDRWRPAFYVHVEDDTMRLLANPGTESERPFSIRDRSATTGLALPLRRIRWTQALTAEWRFEHRIVETADAAARQTRAAARFGWGVSTARRFGYSVSPEGGITSGLSLEVARRAFGSDFDASFARGDLRAFLPGLPRHGVIAVRATGATAGGELEGRRRLRLGGAAADPGVLSLAEDASSLLRGFPANAFQGDRVALLNAEYRLPLAWPQRGVRDWPIFLRSIHATVFGDAGHAWDDGRFRAADVKTSWGCELSSDLTVLHWLPVTATVGVAWGRDGSRSVPDHRQLYVRLGHGF